MQYFKLLLVVALSLAACNSKEREEKAGDNGRIPAKKLEQILYDMQLADVYSLSVRADSSQNFGLKNPDSLAHYYNEIFSHHGVKYEQFSKTIDWYREHPAQFDTIYLNVLNRMSAEDEKNKYKVKK